MCKHRIIDCINASVAKKNIMEAEYLYFRPSLVEMFAKQKMGSVSKLLKHMNKEASWWYRSKQKPTIKLHDVELIAEALSLHPSDFYAETEQTDMVQEEAVQYAANNAAISQRVMQVVQTKTENNQTRFSELVGLSKGQVSNIVAKKHAPGFHTLSRILKAFPDVSARWLITGDGAMNTNDNQDQNLVALLESKEEIIKLLKSQILMLEKQLKQ